MFPRAVWATAFATLVAFMGIGVVDPILPVIGRAMGATPAQVELLFTSYIAIMSLAMTVAGSLATRLGGRRTLLFGLGTVVVFAFLSGHATSVFELAAWRAFWGFGNSLFTSTALSLIVGLTTGGLAQAITLYEAALGLGIASGPLLGGFLGALSWRYPFFGTAALMALAFAFTWFTVPEPPRHEVRRTPLDVFLALKDPALRTLGLVGLFYNYGFFTVLAYSPLYLHLGVHTLGFVFFGWGIGVAVTSVLLAPVLRDRMGPLPPLIGSMAVFTGILVALSVAPAAWKVPLVVSTGLFLGTNNALLTSFAMEVAPVSRSIASAAYNMVRWSGAAVAPWLSGVIAVHSARLPYLISGVFAALAIVLLLGRQELLAGRLRPVGEEA